MLNAWSRKFWGVCFTDRDGRQHLIGEGWAAHRLTRATDAPGRALLFMSRREARNWCRERLRQWSSGDAITAQWRVSPVRVVESVTPTTRGPDNG